jgi:ATP-dependent Clp protease ATP-binding subunit ClpA
MISPPRYSHNARRALSHAAAVVTRFHHAGMDTGHLLVGIMQTEGSIGFQVLQDLNLSADRAEAQLRVLCPVLDQPPNDVNYTDPLNEALALAANESTWLGHHYIGTEHFLLGMTRTNVGNASDLLRLLEVSAEQVRRRVRHALSDGLTESSQSYTRRSARLSELSRRVITAAEQIALELDHQMVGLGHLLLVLLMEKRSFTSALLWECGLDEARLRWGLERKDPLLLVSIDATLNQAMDYAEKIGDHYTGTDHLLLALTGNPAGIAVLQHYGMNTEVLRQQIEDKMRIQR